jgi:hypothetical protein
MPAVSPTMATAKARGPSQRQVHLGAPGRIHPKVVSERLGNAAVPITLDTYSHAIQAMHEGRRH